MADTYFVEVTREALYLVILVSAPPVLASMLVGLVVGALQVSTQLTEHTLSFVPRLLAVLASLIVAGPWIGAQVSSFTRLVLESLPLLR